MKVLRANEFPGDDRLRPSSKDIFRVGSHGKVLFEIWLITPAFAAELLKKVHNRPLKPSRVVKYAQIQVRGAWEMNYEWIGLDEEGYVVEGQHRLHACVRSDTPIHALVLSNYPRELFPTLGVCLPRSLSDNLALIGTPQAKLVQAALAYIHRAENGLPLYASGSGNRPENDEGMALAERHPDIHESVNLARAAWRTFSHTGMLGALHYLFAKKDKSAADTFVARIADGVGLSASDPVYALRERLLDVKSGKLRMRVKDILAITIKAWNYTRAGRRAPKYLRWSEGANEPFPTIE